MRYVLIALYCVILLTSCRATQPKRNRIPCQHLVGSWHGHFQDTQGLFVKKSFPIGLQITYDKGWLIGYSLLNHKPDPIGLGQSRHYFAATCHGNHIGQVRLLPAHHCGAINHTTQPLSDSKLQLKFAWENAMTGTMLFATLQKDKQALPIHLGALNEAKALAHQRVKTCH